MSATILPFNAYDRAQRDRRIIAIRGSINARAAYLKVPDNVRRRWVIRGLDLFAEGASADWAIQEALRGMMDEVREGEADA